MKRTILKKYSVTFINKYQSYLRNKIREVLSTYGIVGAIQIKSEVSYGNISIALEWKNEKLENILSSIVDETSTNNEVNSCCGLTDVSDFYIDLGELLNDIKIEVSNEDRYELQVLFAQYYIITLLQIGNKSCFHFTAHVEAQSYVVEAIKELTEGGFKITTSPQWKNGNNTLQSYFFHKNWYETINIHSIATKKGADTRVSTKKLART